MFDFISRENPASFQFIHSPTLKRDLHFSKLVFGDFVIVEVGVLAEVLAELLAEVVVKVATAIVVEVEVETVVGIGFDIIVGEPVELSSTRSSIRLATKSA